MDRHGVLTAVCLVVGMAGAAQRLEVGEATGPVVVAAPLSGTALPVWGSLAKYRRMAEGFRRGGFDLFRFPNGTLSNEYHWNGNGEWDSVGIWHSRDSAYAPGFLADLLHRGTTRDNYGSTFPSEVFDGDTATFWWGVGDSAAPPWFVADFRRTVLPDSLEILWGSLRPAKVAVQSFRGSDDHGQGPHTAMAGSWTSVGTGIVHSSVSSLRLRGDSTRYLALRFEGIPTRGVQVREVRAWSGGQILSRNVSIPREQTRGIGLGTFPGSRVKRAWQPRDWDFETYLATLRKEWPGSEPLICVNLGTGTPEEAAAWVHYANKVKGHGIRRWQVGNEIDGDWEDGGPLDAAQVASRFLAYSRAMKAQDSTVEVLGPVFASMDWSWCGSGKADGRTWMETFLAIVGEAERRDGRRWLDGIDFHAYPYWWNDGEVPDPTHMLHAADRLGADLDSLRAMMGRNLSKPESREVAMTEYNSTVKTTYLTLTRHTGSLVALMLGHLASRFGDRALACLWEPSSGEPMNPDGSRGDTYGALRIFTAGRRGLSSDLGDPPTGAFWGEYLARSWMGKGLRPLGANLSGDGRTRAFALGDGKSVSILAVNLTSRPDTLTVSLPATTASEGELLTWGEAEYAWDGTTSQARAFPNAGPVAHPWKAGEAVVIPPYGTALVRTGNVPTERPRVLHRLSTATSLRTTDTLGISWSVAAPGDRFATAWWSLDAGARKALPGLDGAWDGSHGVGLLGLAGKDLGIGRHRIALGARARSGAELSDTVEFEVTGTPRIVDWIDRFEPPASGDMGSDWSPYVHKDPATSHLDLRLEPQLDTTGGNRSYLSFEFVLHQPSDLSYPNFATAGLEFDPAKYAKHRPIGVVFDYAAQYETGDGVMSLYLISSQVQDYDDHRTVLAPTGGRWKRDTVWFADFAQEGWGKPVGPLDFAAVSKVELRAQGAGSGTLKFDNFCLIGTEGDSLPLPPLPVSPRRRGR